MKQIGLIGLGDQMQEELIPALRTCEDLCTVVALCDIDAKKLDQTKKIFPNAKRYKDYRALINASVIDAVVVSIPHYLYFPIVTYAVAKKIPIFKEKPFMMNKNEATKILKLYERTGVPIYTVSKRRFYDSYQMGKRYLKDLGSLYRYTARHFLRWGKLHLGWRSSMAEAGGGVFMDLGYHMVDMTRDFFGMPQKVCMLKSKKEMPGYHYEVEDTASLLSGYPRGLHGLFEVGCFSGLKEESLEIVGSDGYMRIEKERVFVKNKNTTAEYTYSLDSTKVNSDAFREFFKGNKDTMKKNIYEHYDNMCILDAAYNSERHNIWSRL
ncbi:MAG: Gfo/Idh/MocA family oxidoreductase [Candidatus Gottesmanbacteria bacterium]|nr:Gfo/Idh/MocA family oxidoreductase [Candidatus Gottesmanbacteria bacterium]